PWRRRRTGRHRKRARRHWVAFAPLLRLAWRQVPARENIAVVFAWRTSGRRILHGSARCAKLARKEREVGMSGAASGKTQDDWQARYQDARQRMITRARGTVAEDLAGWPDHAD